MSVGLVLLGAVLVLAVLELAPKGCGCARRREQLLGALSGG